MSRNHLLILSTRPRPSANPATNPGVWRMTMDVLGQAFGVPAARQEPQQEGRR